MTKQTTGIVIRVAQLTRKMAPGTMGGESRIATVPSPGSRVAAVAPICRTDPMLIAT